MLFLRGGGGGGAGGGEITLVFPLDVQFSDEHPCPSA